MSYHERVSIYPDWMLPSMPPPPVPRISGSAMPGGVHMSTGTVRTSTDWQLALTGLSIAALGALAMVLTYVVTWLVGQQTGLPLVPYLLQIAAMSDQQSDVAFQIGLNALTLLSFLVLMRLSPLSGYHAAEHKVIGAIEHFGELTEEGAWAMPRAHRRCGSNLLAGVLPALLVGVPLMSVSVLAGTAVIVLGWGMRFHTGYFIQQVFATREPSARQMRGGLEAGRKLLAEWSNNPYRRVAPLVNLWRRGFVQMFVGLVVGLQAAGMIYAHLHLWLDF
ncbi:MAG TPA: DUF1385 domain-containing protein [Armatimonadota bacterium]|nr:DUF1385 domain-containing protein [Armatimonadota bacterium]